MTDHVWGTPVKHVWGAPVEHVWGSPPPPPNPFALVALPPTAPRVRAAPRLPRVIGMPAASPQTLRLLGRALLGHEGAWRRPVWLPLASRFEGVHIPGATRQGKSTLIHNLAVDDIQADRAIWVFDPQGQGELVDALLPFIPERRRDDLVYLDLEHPTHVPALNPFFCPNPDDWMQRDVTLNRVTHLWDKVFGPLAEMPQLSMVLRHTTEAMLDIGGTMSDAWRLLKSQDFRRSVTPRLRGPNRLWWEELDEGYSAKNPRVFNEQTNSTLNKIDAFLSLAHVRHIVDVRERRFTAEELVAGNKIVLVKLSDTYKDLTRLVGTQLLMELWQALQARGASPASRAHPVMLYLDEVHLMASRDLEALLTGGAKYGSCPTVAYQEMSQLQKVSDQLLGAVEQLGSTISFQLTTAQAARLAGKYDNQRRRDTEVAYRPIRVPSAYEPDGWETLTRSDMHQSIRPGRFRGEEVSDSEYDIPIMEQYYPLLPVDQAKAHTEAELSRLDPYFAKARIRVNAVDEDRPTYSEHLIRTLPPRTPPDGSSYEEMVMQSLERYCVRRDEAERDSERSQPLRGATISPTETLSRRAQL